MPRRRLRAGLRQADFARRNHLRQHHGGGHNASTSSPSCAGAVLHHEHAERVAGAQHRHAEEGVVDFFAGFRAIRERRMACASEDWQRRLAGDKTDQAFCALRTVRCTASRFRPSVA